MQITSIQNIIRNNFQYKNNSAKFNPVIFKGQDTFERKTPDDVVVSKKYHRGDKEFDQSLFTQQGQALFIEEKGSYIPYYAALKEYNSKGEIIRHSSFSNGFRHIVDTYKNGKKIQQDRYEDIYSSVKNATKRTSVIKFSHSNIGEVKQTFGISRNYGKNWKNHPMIAMRKNGKNDSLFVSFATSSDYKRGEIEVNYSNAKGKNYYFNSPIYDEINFALIPYPLESINETALLALIELKETLENEEFRADFGENAKFNSELNKAIEFLSSKLNED